tara:strand:- start:2789 stop:3952 length:1164 start_codon:yes stop_codon:yes gene_type:complete
MAIDPLKKLPKNRALQYKKESIEQGKGVKLFDVDLAIAEHMIDTVLPTVEIFEEKQKIPVVYGNPERWKGVQVDGFLRDKKGVIQIPLVMFKRNSIERNDVLSNTMNRHVSYPSVSKYSKKHRYDKFSAMTATEKPVELYDIVIPDYVTLTYEVIIWTDFTEHMNKVVEAFQYATDEYWGDKNGFKFRVKIDSFDNTTELSEGSQRIVRTNFTMAVNAYLLPEQFDNESTHKKSISPKKVVFGLETDLTGLDGGNVTNSTIKKKLLNEYADVIDFVSIRGASQGSFVDADTMKLTSVELPKLPPELIGTFDEDEWFRVYINGVLIPKAKYNFVYTDNTDEVYFNFSTGSLSEGGTYPTDLQASSTDLGFILENDDEFGVTGKFIELS